MSGGSVSPWLLCASLCSLGRMKRWRIIVLLLAAAFVLGGGCPLSPASIDSVLPPNGVEVKWTGEPMEFEIEGSGTLRQLLEVKESSFTPERVLGNPGLHTILEFDDQDNIVAIHTTYDLNKQWVKEPLPISDAFFLKQDRTSSLLLASPSSRTEGNGVELTDEISGTWRYGSISVETSVIMTGIRRDVSARGAMTQTATFTVVDSIPASVILGFAGVEAGETLSYSYVLFVEYTPVNTPEREGFQLCEIIAAPPGTLPYDIGIQGGGYARLLDSFGVFQR